MKQRHMSLALFATLSAGLMLAGGCGNGRGAALSPSETNKAIVTATSSALVHVEYTLQYDKGEEPRGGQWGSYGDHIRQERAEEVAGLLVAGDKVLTADLMIHPRFIKSIAVRYGDSLVAAELDAYAVDRKAVVLKLAAPLAGAKPVEFDAKRTGPYFSVSHTLREDEWITSVRGAGTGLVVTETGKEYHPASGCWLIVDTSGASVGVCSAGRLDIEGKWKGSPLDWPARSAKEMADLVATTTQRADAGILRVALSFRSPKKSAGSSSSRSSSGSSGKAEMNVVGLLIDETTVVVLAELEPQVTARLERIAVHTGDDSGIVEAEFSSTLTDYGCFIAKLKTPVKGSVKLSTKPVTALRNQMLMAAEVMIQGVNRVTYFDHRRIDGYALGWKRHVYPQVGGKTSSLFLLDEAGELVVFPLARRPKAASGGRRSQGEVRTTSSDRLDAVLADLANNVDTDNKPLPAEEESRLAWMGVELQPLNPQLASMNNLSDRTKNGQVGALVSYVYPGSPAALAGVTADLDGEPWFLLNLQVEGHPAPIDVRGERSVSQYNWENWDRIPPSYWDGKIPTPWPPAESRLNRELTNVGFDKKYVATFFTGGKPVEKTFTVVACPPHYESAGSYKSVALGVTVRDLTFEARRFFQKTATDPGVIVYAIEPGSTGGVGGLRPLEIITHVNDKPVADVTVFEKLIANQAELRLTVVRMTKGRLVKLKAGGS